MGKFARSSWLLAFLIGVGIAAGWWSRPRPRPVARRSAPAIPLLDRRTGPLDFNNVPLEQVIDQLSLRAQCTICVDWRGLAVSSVTPQTRVGVGFDDRLLRGALELILESVLDREMHIVQKQSERPITVWEDDGVVYVGPSIHSIASLERIEARVYDIHDIVTPVPGSLAVDRPDPPVQSSTGSGGLFGGSGIWAPRFTGPYGAHVGNVVGVVRFIETEIDPDSWKETGGSLGTVRESAHLLIITQTVQNHERIANLLSHLRTARDAVNRHAPPVIGGINYLVVPRAAR